MSEEVTPQGLDLSKQPHRSLLKRIDIGLMTGLCALFLSFVGLIMAQSSHKLDQAVQKAEVLPIISIEMGYGAKLNANGQKKQHYEVVLSNVGAGLAHVQSVTPTLNGEPIEAYGVFEDAIMTGRMLSWASVSEQPSTGYIRAGEDLTPVSYYMGSNDGEVAAYLRGEWGAPMAGVDLEVCYCSVFDDCWRVSYVDRKVPQSVKSCGIRDTTDDAFRDYMDQRMSARLNPK